MKCNSIIYRFDDNNAMVCFTRVDKQGWKVSAIFENDSTDRFWEASKRFKPSIAFATDCLKMAVKWSNEDSESEQ